MFRPDSRLLQTGEAAWRRDVTRVPGAASGIFEQKIYKYKKRGKRMFTKLTEQLKAKQPMEWIGLMNNIQACAREIVNNEIIFS